MTFVFMRGSRLAHHAGAASILLVRRHDDLQCCHESLWSLARQETVRHRQVLLFKKVQKET